MPAEAPPKAKRETWADWLATDHPAARDYVTLEELLTLLPQEVAVNDVDARDLRHWQMNGILPYPKRTWHKGAVRALFPRQAALLTIFELRDLQRRGYALRQIGERLRVFVGAIYKSDPHDLAPIMVATARKHEDLIKRSVKRAEVSFIDEDDRNWTYVYIIPSN